VNVTIYINPEIVKAFRTSLTFKRFLMVLTLGLCTGFLVAGLAWTGTSRHWDYDDNFQVRTARQAFELYTVILGGLFFVFAPALTSLSIVQEKLRGTAVFQQMSSLSPFQMALGKLVGSNLLTALFALVLGPFFVFSAVLAEIRLARFARFVLFFVLGGLCCQAIGLLVSSVCAGRSDKIAKGILLIGPAVGGLGGIVGLSSVQFFRIYYDPAWPTPQNFYGVLYDAAFAILFLFILGAASAFAGAVRQIRSNQLLPMQRWPIWVFMVVFEVVIVGLNWGRPIFPEYSYPPNAEDKLFFFILVNWLAVLILSGFSAFNYEQLCEAWNWSSSRYSSGSVLTKPLVSLGVLVLLAEIGIFALWHSYHVPVEGVPLNTDSNVQLTAIMAAFFLTSVTTAAMVQFCALHKLRISGWSGAGIAIAFFTLITVAGVVTQYPSLKLVSPLEMTSELAKSDIYMTIRYPPTHERDEALPAIGTASGYPRVTLNNDIKVGLLEEGLLALTLTTLTLLKFNRARRRFDDCQI
jgi:ABC-2 family transporter protein